MLESPSFADEGGKRQAPLGVCYLNADGISNACMESGMEDGLANARAQNQKGGVRPQITVGHEVTQDGVHGAFTKFTAEATFARAAGDVAGIRLDGLV